MKQVVTNTRQYPYYRLHYNGNPSVFLVRADRYDVRYNRVRFFQSFQGEKLEFLTAEMPLSELQQIERREDNGR